MMLALGMFVFMRQTLPHQTMQRESDYRWPSNSRIGKRDAYQFLGVGEENITLTGVLYPELTGGKLTMTTLRLMAEEGRAWPLLDGTGMIYGMFTLIFPMTLPVVLLQMLVAWFAMMASSGYCIALILHARRQGKISTGTAVLQVISQFIYVVDVISLFFIRKTVKECKTAQ